MNASREPTPKPSNVSVGDVSDIVETEDVERGLTVEDDDDEQNPELVVDREGEADEDAVQKHTELEDRNADDLRRGGVPDGVRDVVGVGAPVRLDVRVRVWELGFAPVLVDVPAVGVADLLLRAQVRALLGGLVDLWPVRRVGGEPVAVRVVHEPEAREAGGAPAEGDELDDEDEEDAEQANS